MQARLAQLQAERAAALKISVPFLTAELLAVARESRALGQGSAAAQAYMGIAKMHGFLVDRHQVDAFVRRPSASPESPDEMSEVEWMKTHGLITVIDHEDTTAILSEPAEVVSSSSDEDTTDMLTPTDKSPLEGSGSG